MARRIFLDTNPIIYILDKQQHFFSATLKFISDNVKTGSDFFTSVITDTEFLTMPYKKEDLNSELAYCKFMQILNVNKIPIDESIAKTAAKLRAKYKSIKLGDSLQLAASIEHNCDCFLTNDEQLKQVTEASICYIGDLILQ